MTAHILLERYIQWLTHEIIYNDPAIYFMIQVTPEHAHECIGRDIIFKTRGHYMTKTVLSVSESGKSINIDHPDLNNQLQIVTRKVYLKPIELGISSNEILAAIETVFQDRSFVQAYKYDQENLLFEIFIKTTHFYDVIHHLEISHIIHYKKEFIKILHNHRDVFDKLLGMGI